jgi:autotransporter-associated beta strand protein
MAASVYFVHGLGAAAQIAGWSVQIICTRKKSRAGMAAFCLGASALALAGIAPALGAVVDYPNGSTNSSPIVLTDGTTQLQVTTGTATQSGVISESGGSFGFEKIGLGTLVLTGANTYSGTTTVSDNGVLQVGNNGATGSLGTGAVVINNSTLSFNLSSAYTAANAISGSGTLNQGGSGTLTLTTANSFGGVTQVQGGSTLALSSAGSVANSAVIETEGTFDISALASGTSIKSLDGFSGQVTLGNNTLTITNGFFGNYSGTITGAGGLTILGGSEQLTSAESYTGATVIMGGAKLIISNTGSLATSSGVVDNGFFDPGGSSVKSLTGTGVLSGAVTITNAFGTFAGAITSAVTIAGGAQILSGDGRSSTALTVNSGASLSLTGVGAFENATLTNNGMFDISGTTTGAVIQFLTGIGTINLGSQTLTLVNPSATGFNSVFSGVITGTGGVVITGGTGGSGATHTFAGANTYSGATVIQTGGTLTLAPGGSIDNSTVQNAGTLVLTPSTVTLPSGTLHFSDLSA